MKHFEINPYPGSNAKPCEIVALADEYRLAANSLTRCGRRGVPISRAPAHLCAIHAVELYLNAFLMHEGLSPQELRGHFHNLAERNRLAADKGLILRKRTSRHLNAMTVEREYLISRYGPEMTASLSEINRMAATLEEISTKVKCRVKR